MGGVGLFALVDKAGWRKELEFDKNGRLKRKKELAMQCIMMRQVLDFAHVYGESSDQVPPCGLNKAHILLWGMVAKNYSPSCARRVSPRGSSFQAQNLHIFGDSNLRWLMQNSARGLNHV